MNSPLPNREQALRLLQTNNVPSHVVNHCIAVSFFAIEIAHKLQAKGLQVNLQLLEVGALLHDLGRSKSHTVDHGVVGAQIGQTMNLPLALINIIKRHVGAGITIQEAQKLCWPEDIYVPQTLEEKIVCYADKRVDQDVVIPIETEIQRLQKEGKVDAAERVRSLHNEITSLLDESL